LVGGIQNGHAPDFTIFVASNLWIRLPPRPTDGCLLGVRRDLDIEASRRDQPKNSSHGKLGDIGLCVKSTDNNELVIIKNDNNTF